MSVIFDLMSARLNKGMAQRELADKIGVSREVIRRLELGYGAHPANAKKVADYFGVQVTDVLPSEPQSDPEPHAA